LRHRGGRGPLRRPAVALGPQRRLWARRRRDRSLHRGKPLGARARRHHLRRRRVLRLRRHPTGGNPLSRHRRLHRRRPEI
ncbi:hypothetical protein LTR94_034772, partial [Friedmanniomyces endolithicus]